MDEAIAEYREALRLAPDFCSTHYQLGLALRARGEFTEAIAEFRKARDLARTSPLLVRTNPQYAEEMEGALAATERMASLARRLPAVRAGKARPADAVEALDFAQLCYERKLQGASARLWAEGFQAQPNLADAMKVQNRYNAACAAALAGSSQSKDDPPLDEAGKARWRKQALDWLKADLAEWSKLLASGQPQARQSIPKTLRWWKVDPDLAGLHDPAMLARLPMPEQAPWRELWSAVDRLLEQAQGPPSK
jgi:tetratricopeptide (TPR) repeat protein